MTKLHRIGIDLVAGIMDPFGAFRIMAKLLGEAVENTENAAREGMQQLELESRRQELTMKMQERHSRVLQELALAYRIRTAEEIEIEEHFEGRGEGSAGVNAGEEVTSIGLSGSGERITRRIYRLKGWNPDLAPSQPAPVGDDEDGEGRG